MKPNRSGGGALMNTTLKPLAKFLRIFLAFALVLGLMPTLATTQAFATDTTDSGSTEIIEQGGQGSTEGSQSGGTGGTESGSQSGGSSTEQTETGGTETEGSGGTEGSGTESGGGSAGTGEGSGETETSKEASIGTTEYDTLKEAFEKVQTGETIKLLKDVSGAYGLCVKDKKVVTFDMNGKKITSDYSTCENLDTHPNNRIIAVEGGASLTITGNGTITGPTAATMKSKNLTDMKSMITVKEANSTLTIENGNISCELSDDKKGFYGLFVSEGGTLILGTKDGNGPNIKTARSPIGENNTKPTANVTVYGGTYECLYTCDCTGQTSDNCYEATPFLATASGEINIYGGIFKGTNGFVTRYQTTNQTINIVGGDFQGDKEKGKAILKGTQDGSKTAADVSKANRDIDVCGGTFSCALDADMLGDGVTQAEDGSITANYVAQIGETKFTSLKDAFTKVNDNETIKLIDDVADEYGLTISGKKGVTLDMDGKTITDSYASDKYDAANNSNANECRIIAVVQGGELTIKGNGTIQGPKSTDAAKINDETGLILIDGEGSKLTIEDGTIASEICTTSSSSTTSVATPAADETTTKKGFYATFTRNNGTLILGKEGATGPTMTSGRAPIGENNTKPKANVTVNSGTYECLWDPGSDTTSKDYYESSAFLATASGEITINGGTFKGTNCITSRYSTVSQTLTIKGGDFQANAEKGGVPIIKGSESGQTESGTAAGQTFKVSGGTFSAMLSADICDAGFKPVANGDGTYGVSTKQVAKIGTVEYATLKAAIEGAKDGDTVEMTDNTTDEYDIGVSDKKITLNMNSKTITSQNKSASGFMPYTDKNWPDIIYVTGTGNLTITGAGTIKGPEGAEGKALDGYCLIGVHGDSATLTIEDGTFTCGGEGSDGMYGVAPFNGGNVILGKADSTTGPTITAHFGAIGGNNTKAPTNITVYGGTYKANANPVQSDGSIAWWYYFCTPFYAPADGEIKISGGTFDGYYGLVTRYSNANQTITITGGTFNGTKEAVFRDTKKGTGEAGDNSKVNISGGTFSTKPAQILCADGYTPCITQDDRGNYTVEVATYNVYYEVGDGTNPADNPTSYTFSTTEKKTDLKDATAPEGYTFDGWYSDITYKTKVTQLDETIASDQRLYAKYTKTQAQYVVKHKKETLLAGTYVDEFEIKTGETGATTAEKGKTFEGFVTPEDSAITQQTIKEDGTTVVEITYARKDATATFKMNDGTSTEDFKTVTAKFGAAIEEPENDPTREGYVFVGWYADKDCAYKYDFTSATMPANGITLYASWAVEVTEAVYTVEHQKETLTEGVYDIEYEAKEGTIGELTDAEPKTYEGFISPAKEDIEQVEIKDDGTTFVDIVYKRATYTATFMMNDTDESEEYDTVEAKFGAAFEAPAEDPTLAGHKFNGWYLDQDCEYKYDFTSATMPVDGITLYAGWTVNSYVVTFNTNGQTATVLSQVVAYGDVAEEPGDPHVVGYTFAGWYEEAACTTAFDFKTPITADKVLYAKWESLTPQIEVTLPESAGKVLVNDKEVKNGDIVEAELGKDVTVSVVVPQASGNNVNIISFVTVNDYVGATTDTLDKSKWQTENSLYKKQMGEDVRMTTYELVTTTAQTFTIPARELRADATAGVKTTLEIEFEEVVPVYRLYNKITSEHLFTTDKSEYEQLYADCDAGKDYWIGEGIDWFAPVESETTTPVYRLYNSGLGALAQSSHYYTSNQEEIQTLLNNGWMLEEDKRFGSGGSASIFTCYNEALGSAHHYTSSVTEWLDLADNGWDIEESKNTDSVTGDYTGFFQAVASAKP